MDANEYTGKFDLERWKDGELAFTGNNMVKFQKEDEISFFYLLSSVGEYSYPKKYFITGAETCWRMKPKAVESQESEWIPHHGGPCPIPWAKEGEFSAKRADGQTYGKTVNAKDIQSWETIHIAKGSQIIAYRLTDRWIPVVGDGTIPDRLRGVRTTECEAKMRDGEIIPLEEGDLCVSNLSHIHGLADIVAVRLVKPLPVIIGIDYATGVTPPETEKQRLTSDAEHKYIYEIGISPEKQLQRVLSVMAVNRYKSAHPDPIPFRPLGEEAMNEIAAAALREHDKVWPRKR